MLEWQRTLDNMALSFPKKIKKFKQLFPPSPMDKRDSEAFGLLVDEALKPQTSAWLFAQLFESKDQNPVFRNYWTQLPETDRRMLWQKILEIAPPAKRLKAYGALSKGGVGFFEGDRCILLPEKSRKVHSRELEIAIGVAEELFKVESYRKLDKGRLLLPIVKSLYFASSPGKHDDEKAILLKEARKAIDKLKWKYQDLYVVSGVIVLLMNDREEGVNAIQEILTEKKAKDALLKPLIPAIESIDPEIIPELLPYLPPERAVLSAIYLIASAKQDSSLEVFRVIEQLKLLDREGYELSNAQLLWALLGAWERTEGLGKLTEVIVRIIKHSSNIDVGSFIAMKLEMAQQELKRYDRINSLAEKLEIEIPPLRCEPLLVVSEALEGGGVGTEQVSE
jgi:hypothetical protein